MVSIDQGTAAAIKYFLKQYVELEIHGFVT